VFGQERSNYQQLFLTANDKGEITMTDILKSFTDAAAAIKAVLDGVETQSKASIARMKLLEAQAAKAAEDVRTAISGQLSELGEQIMDLRGKLDAHAKRVNPILKSLQANLDTIERELELASSESVAPATAAKQAPVTRLGKIQAEVDKIKDKIRKAHEALGEVKGK